MNFYLFLTVKSYEFYPAKAQRRKEKKGLGMGLTYWGVGGSIL
ncbi:hypothetical protein LCGC14_1198580 [marine sediment metagenome]|uniref:Uncharacterized protein n=1 Tax=marine sediment metagenome TaxID=412755 RepID=A0A0F9PMC8_9ZZZZ